MSDKAAAGKPDAPPGPSPWTLMLLVMLTFWMCNRPTDPSTGLQQCGKTLHGIGVALERFRLSSDDGLYPKDLAEAYRGSQAPSCPIAKEATYLKGYQPGSDRRAYLLVCKGDHHQQAGVPSDYPRIAFGPHETSSPSEESQSPGSPSPTPAQSPSPQASPAVLPTPVVSGSPGGASATPNP